MSECYHSARNKSNVEIVMGDYGIFECALCKRCGALEVLRRIL